MGYINVNPYQLTEVTSAADKIRAKRQVIHITEEMKKTTDMLEKSGALKKVVYPAYTKLKVIDSPTSGTVKEMREVMNGYYKGEITNEDIKEFFMEYCNGLYARKEETILNVYEEFLDQSYAEAVYMCFQQGREIARKEGIPTDHMVYYNADYYYRSEEAHRVLQEAAKEYGAKYGKEVDASKRDKAFRGDYLTGTPNFNDKWNFMAESMNGSGKIMDLDAVPPKDFSFLYRQGENLATKNSFLFIGGKDWLEQVPFPFKMPAGGKNTERYFYLSDIFHVNKEKDKNYKEYNRFLNQLIILRVWGDSSISVKCRKW